MPNRDRAHLNRRNHLLRLSAACASLTATLLLLSSGALTAAEPSVKETLQKEVQRSQPDYIVYVPGSFDGSTHDGHNEHFLVFDGPDGSLMAIWTQNINAPNGPVGNRIVFSRSTDEGVTWAPPKHLAGPATPKDPAHMASWAFPMVSKSGRIYVLFNRNQGNSGWIQMHTGTMEGIYSDDKERARDARIAAPT